MKYSEQVSCKNKTTKQQDISHWMAFDQITMILYCHSDNHYHKKYCYCLDYAQKQKLYLTCVCEQYW